MPFIDSVNNNKKSLFDMLLNLVTINNEYKYENEVPSTEYGRCYWRKKDEEREGKEIEDDEEFD